MKKKLLTYALIPFLTMSIASCGDKVEESQGPSANPSINPTSESNQESVSESTNPFEDSDTGSYYQPSQQDEVLNLIPEEVLNAECEIDFLVYIEGQDSVKNDIGSYCWDTTDPNYSSYRHHPEDVSSIEMARWFGAAQAFKQLAPGVKINLKYCSIADYPTRVEKYQETYGHLPELMWGTEHVVEMLQKGYCVDLSQYDTSEYYDKYNEYFMSRFNFGGFQAGFPIAAEPWGTFVNLDILSDPTNPVVTSVISDGECTEEYRDWVDNFTWEELVDAVKKTNNDSHAGLSQIVEYFLSYSVASINEQFIAEGTVDLTSDDVKKTIQTLLGYENELSQYCVYQYDDITGASGNQAKSVYAGAAPWYATKDFCENQYCTFYAENPWSLPTISQYVTSRAGQSGLVKNVDFLPYPKVNAESDAYTGIAVEGLVVGNQCPIVDGEEQCYSSDSKLKQDVAAYFAMFAGLDPRAAKARNEIQYIVDSTKYVGDLSLPLCKRDVKFNWQYDETITELYPDPAADYDDNWTYELYNWLNLYNLYVTNTDKKMTSDMDLKSNIMYGLYKMLDSMYMIESDTVTCLNYWNEPVKIEVGGEEENIFDQWQGRFTYFRTQDDDTGLYSGSIGTSTYVSEVLAHLSDMETRINTNSAKAWSYLNSCVSDYYYDEAGDALYPDIEDKSYRTDYEGSKYN